MKYMFALITYDSAQFEVLYLEQSWMLNKMNLFLLIIAATLILGTVGKYKI